MKKRFRIALDIVMAALMPVLMAYSLVGEALHEIVGSAIFIMFIVHHVLNRKWYCAAFRDICPEVPCSLSSIRANRSLCSYLTTYL